MIKEFPNTGKDFSGFDAAYRFLGGNDYSYGPMQCEAPIGIMRGDVCIAKWRNMSAEEHNSLDGVITFRDGGPRYGTAIVEIYER